MQSLQVVDVPTRPNHVEAKRGGTEKTLYLAHPHAQQVDKPPEPSRTHVFDSVLKRITMDTEKSSSQPLL